MTLEEIREKIAALEIKTLTTAVEHGYFTAKEDVLDVFDTAIADERVRGGPKYTPEFLVDMIMEAHALLQFCDPEIASMPSWQKDRAAFCRKFAEWVDTWDDAAIAEERAKPEPGDGYPRHGGDWCQICKHKFDDACKVCLASVEPEEPSEFIAADVRAAGSQEHAEPAKPEPCAVCGGSGLIHDSHGSPYGSVSSNCPECSERPEPAKPELGDVVAVCEACGQHLGLNEIDPYGNGYCHAIPNGDPTTGEMWPEPCGPVYLWRAADVRSKIEEAGK